MMRGRGQRAGRENASSAPAVPVARHGPVSVPGSPLGMRVRGWLHAQVDALPLAAFLALAAWLSPVSPASWRPPYVVALLLAIAVHGARLLRNEPLDRVHLALGGYFASGAAGLLLGWTALNDAYGALEATAMLLWLLPVGLAFTLWSPAGFVAAPGAPAGRVRAASWALLLLACAVAGWSAAHLGEPLHGAVLPFVVLFTGQALLRGWTLRGVSGAPPR
jgi:hypothetical protein